MYWWKFHEPADDEARQKVHREARQLVELADAAETAILTAGWTATDKDQLLMRDKVSLFDEVALKGRTR